MILDHTVLAIIPARGGSKGLPQKNIRNLCGRPLVQWSIDTALQCSEIDAVVVSTDDERTQIVATASGAEVPFMRPADLSSDTASSIDVVNHAVEYLEGCGRFFDIVLLLEPTSPLREAADIQLALRRMINLGASAVVSVCRSESSHPRFMFRIKENNRLESYLPASPSGVRRQEIEALFYPDGTLYASYVNALKQRKSFYHEDTISYEISKWKAIEIDDIEDFEMVEALANHKALG